MKILDKYVHRNKVNDTTAASSAIEISKLSPRHLLKLDLSDKRDSRIRYSILQ